MLQACPRHQAILLCWARLGMRVKLLRHWRATGSRVCPQVFGLVVGRPAWESCLDDDEMAKCSRARVASQGCSPRRCRESIKPRERPEVSSVLSVFTASSAGSAEVHFHSQKASNLETGVLKWESRGRRR